MKSIKPYFDFMERIVTALKYEIRLIVYLTSHARVFQMQPSGTRTCCDRRRGRSRDDNVGNGKNPKTTASGSEFFRINSTKLYF